MVPGSSPTVLLQLRRQRGVHVDDTAIRITGTAYRLYEGRTQLPFKLTKELAVERHEDAMAELDRAVRRKSKIGFQELSRVVDSPWLAWFDELDGLAARISGDAGDVGLTVRRSLTWNAGARRELSFPPVPDHLAGYMDLMRCAGVYRWSFDFSTDDVRAGFTYLVYADAKHVTWSIFGGPWGTTTVGDGMVESDGVMRGTMFDDPVEWSGPTEFRLEFPKLVRRGSDAQIAGF